MTVLTIQTDLKRLQTGLHPRSVRLLCLLGLVAMLTGCGADEGDDLDQFIRDSGKDMVGHVDPLPEVKPYIPAEYNPDQLLHDPFMPRKADIQETKGFQPNLNRPREQLEAFPLESLQVVGVIKQGKNTVALIKTPENSVHQVKIGNYLGQNFGMVTEIATEAPIEVKIKEIVQDELTGGWTERPASLVQQEPKA